MNVTVRVHYGQDREGLPETAEVEWTDAVDQPESAQIYAVLGLLTEVGRRRTVVEVNNGGTVSSPGEQIAAALAKVAGQGRS